MSQLASKSLNEITVDDILALEGSPESSALEFKAALDETNQGQPLPAPQTWAVSGKLHDNAAKDIFKEIVAFANAQGGDLLLGVAENANGEACAFPGIANAESLAKALENKASGWIDPILPGLHIKAIVTGSNGDGCVIIRVPASYRAPHALIGQKGALTAYVRRGKSSEPMKMPDIQDMTINLSRRIDRIEAMFDKRREIFSEWCDQNYDPDVGHNPALRITAIPLTEIASAFRAASDVTLARVPNMVSGTLCGKAHNFPFPYSISTTRPILRGLRGVEHTVSRKEESYCEVMDDGLIELAFIRSRHGDPVIFFGWLASAVAQVLFKIAALRDAIGQSGLEYGIEVEINTRTGPSIIAPAIQLRTFEGEFDFPLLLNFPVRLPKISFMEIGDASNIILLIWRDIINAAGVNLNPDFSFEIDLAAL